MKKQTGKSCFGCKHFIVKPTTFREECTARPGIQHLKQWPFLNTKCQEFKSNTGIANNIQPNVVSVSAPHSTPNRQGSFMSIDFWKNKR